jgi:peptidoglycan/xylan/chitin deacetylase (PgdA/CDA1 family)
MSWQSLAVVRTGGIEIGAHTRTHRDLAVLPPAAIEEELASGAERIAAELGMKPVSFAYPYGSTSAAAVQAARRYFHVACGTELRVLSASDDPVQLPRLDAYYFRSPGQLEAWGSRPFRQRLWFRAQGRRVRRLVQPVTRTM